MKFIARIALLIGALQVGGHAWAQTGLAASFGLVVYPSGGQAPDQQAKDEGECFTWSKQTTGVDPANPLAGVQTQQPQQAPAPGAGAAQGAVRGAAGAALIGNIADEDAGEYALAGALIGGVRGSRQAKQQQAQAQAQAKAQADAQTAERMTIFSNAFGACMAGRNYTVR
jgi:hypothetical protein